MLGMLWGVLYVCVPMVTGALLPKRIEIVPMIFIDFTPQVSQVLPAVPFTVVIDFVAFVSISRLEDAFKEGDWAKMVYPMDIAVQHLPSVTLDEENEKALINGRPPVLTPGEEIPKGLCRAYSIDGRFIVLLRYDEERSFGSQRRSSPGKRAKLDFYSQSCIVYTIRRRRYLPCEQLAEQGPGIGL